MQSLEQYFQVPFRYQVIFSKGLFQQDNPVFKDFILNFGLADFRKRIVFVIDKGVADAHPNLTSQIVQYFETFPVADLAPEILILPGGEVCKNDPRFYEEVVRAIDEHRIDRHSFVACIGGGAFLDMSGYAAAISHRGVKFIRIPSTVLSQNDSGVGVKNGVNYMGKKNFLGTFAPPVAVFNDVDLLATLNDRDWRSGIAEAIKVALIKDLAFFQWLEANAQAMNERNEAVMIEQIYRCAELHMQHISSGDPFELGSARPLDFGHWAAHKLEYLSNFEIRHGEAVAIGIALDTAYSHEIGYLTAGERDRVIAVIRTLGFDTYHPALAENDKANLFKGLQEFQEHLGGQLCITLLEKLGKGKEVHEMNFDLIKKSVDFLAQLG
ncbi:3-dehydroquinate synthase [Aquirufa nivalisilvae]|uniref:3-dehydroquinate synthase n=1 Tax=Aquirufa nivalisilvae TaxID=2516557 RepID=UPI0022A9EA13|nr:3-dehydroquinate synthase [Aquirufa nivalisilvae]MCZ2479308.1 3-dehydroquinate synthase [Aquirufa nivalisilvae]